MNDRNVVSRRGFLRSSGAIIGLPFLESLGATAENLSGGASKSLEQRVLFMYTPNGVIRSQWMPTGSGRDWELSPTLKSLTNIKSDIAVISGLSRRLVSHQVHGQACCCWMSSAEVEKWSSGPYPIARTLDQLIGADKESVSLYPTVALSCNDFSDNKESAYFDSISWLAAGRVASAEKNPRTAFNRLFNVSGGARGAGSILDTVLSDAKGLAKQMSRSDNARLEEFLEGVRLTEQLIQKRETRLSRAQNLELNEPDGIPKRRGDYIRMMGNLICHAFEMDLSRVGTLVVDPERWSSPRMFHGLFDSAEDHHMLTHNNSSSAEAKVAAIDRFHVDAFHDVVSKLKTMKSAGGKTLFDDCLVVMGSGMGDGYTHSLDDLPLLLAGNAGGALKMDQHVRVPSETPLDNLWLTIRNVCGRKRGRFADSTGVIRELLS